MAIHSGHPPAVLHDGYAADPLAERPLSFLLNTVVGASPAGIAVFDTEGRYILANESLAALNGLPASDHIGRRMADVVPRLADQCQPLLERALRGERVTSEASSGDPAVADVRMVVFLPIKDDLGNIVGATAIVHDQTAQTRQKQALEEAYGYLEALFETVPVGLMIFDRQLRVVRLNQRVAGWNNVNPDMAVGRPASEVFSRRWPVVRGNYERALRGERFSIEFDRRAAGEVNGPAVVSAAYSPVYVDGSLAGVMVCGVDITPRLDHERELAAAYAEMESIYNNVPVGIAVYDLSLKLTSMNERMSAWTGVPVDEARGKHPRQILRTVWPAVEAYYALALQGEACSVQLDRRALGEARGPVNVTCSYMPVRVAGVVVGVAVTVTDITAIVRETLARERAHRALLEAYAQVEALFDHLPVGLAMLDRELRVVRLNRRIAHSEDFESSEVIGKHIAEVFPDRWQDGREYYRRALRGERLTVELERSSMREGFEHAHLSVLYAPILVDGQVVGVMTCAIDDTERVLQQQALAAAYAQLESIFQNVPIGIAVYDHDLRLIRENEHMAEWTLADTHDVLGLHVSDVIPKLWPVVAAYYERALRGEECSVDLDRRASGETSGPAVVTCNYVPIVMEGHVVGITVTVTDISDRVEHERAIEAQARFQEDIIHISSHELRTPLTSIIGFAERLKRQSAANSEDTLGSVSEDLDLIHAESQRMARTLDMILDMVGLAAGSAPMEREPVALVPLVRREMAMLRERYPEVALADEALEHPIVSGDGDRIAQVITNLLENAAKYAGAHAQVRVQVRVEGSPPDVAAVDVEDDGPGIPFAEQGAIFARRYRGHTGDGVKGLGLGLYLSRSIATQLDGSLTVASVPGHGATFTLRLPLLG